MAKFRSNKFSLLGGEVSPTAFGRTDIPLYQAACKTFFNMIPLLSGGAYRRPGTMFDTNLGAVSAIYAPHIIPFQVSQQESYVIEIGKTINDTGYAKSHLPIGSVVATSTADVDLDDVTGSIDTSDTFTAVAATDIVTHSITELFSYRKVRLTTTGTLPGGLSLNTTYWTIYISATTVYLASSLANAQAGAASRIDITSVGSGTHTMTMVDVVPWQHATSSTTTFWYDEWRDVQYAQSADTMWIVHPNRKPRKLIRVGVNSFQMIEFDQDLTTTNRRDAWPYLARNTTSTTMTFGSLAIGDETTLTASTAYFSTSHVGAMFKLESASNTGCAIVTGYTSATVVTIRVVQTIPSGLALTTWYESAWSDYRGWPRTVCFYRSRLAYGGSANNPDTIWFSQDSDYNQLSDALSATPFVSTLSSDAFAIQLVSDQLDLIQWMSPSKSLALGTSGGEWLIDLESSSLTDGFGWSNSSAIKQSNYGSAYTMAQRVGNEILFCQADEEEVKSFIFNFQEDSFIAEPLQTFYDEFPYPDDNTIYNGNRKIRGLIWDKSRSTLWCYDTSGKWRTLTHDRRQGVNLWASQELGGFDSTVVGSAIGSPATVDPVYINPTGSVISMCTIPNLETRQQDIWMVVYRKVNGTFRFYLEKINGRGNLALTSAYGRGYSHANIFAHTDCSFWGSSEYPGAEDYSYTNLSHLEGETPVGTARNQKGWFYVTGSAVSGGATTLQTPYPGGYLTGATQITWGYNFNSIIVPLRIEAGSQIGTAQDAIKRIHKVFVRFYKTMAAKIGRDASNLETVVFREPDTALAYSAEFFTGDKMIEVDSEHDRDGYLYILQDRPLPFAVISIVSEGFTFD